MGIPMTVTLITGPIADQMFIQRAMAVKQDKIVKTFVWGGLIFGLVPITLSILGFMGVSLTHAGEITVDDPQMVGPVVISHLLPKAALYAFVFMAFAGLCSTLDSAFCAISSLGGIDIYKRYIAQDAKDKRILKAARITMAACAVIGVGIALLRPNMLWTFMIVGSITASLFFPVIFSLFWKRVPAKGVFWAVAASLVLGLPFSIYANVNGNPYMIVASALTGITFGLVICLVSGLMNKTDHYDFKQIQAR